MMTFLSNMTEPTIIFENDDVLVINKPTGLRVHNDGFSTEDTVVDWFLRRVPTALGIGEVKVAKNGTTIERSGVVHRLDIATSGIMILAKNQEAFLHLKNQFKNRLVKKEYRALVYGLMSERWGTIDRPIGRNARDFRKRSAERGSKGVIRDAITNWECVGKGEYNSESYSYLKLMPKTGRMHQLRVHLKAIDRPIVCDTVYAGKRVEQSNNLGLTRLALHSQQLEITLPTGEIERFVAPLPQEMMEAVDLIEGD
jgi:23S rRNA pseudouridine1911/1915/1917 synthase